MLSAPATGMEKYNSVRTEFKHLQLKPTQIKKIGGFSPNPRLPKLSFASTVAVSVRVKLCNEAEKCKLARWNIRQSSDHWTISR